MKKSILALLLAGLLLTTVACGKDDGKKEESSTPVESTSAASEAGGKEEPSEGKETDKIAEAIKADVTFKDGMTKLETEKLANNAYPTIIDIASDYTLYVNATGGYAEEIAVMQPRDGFTLDDMEKLAEARIDSQKTAFENYRPDEMTKLEKPVMVKNVDKNILVLVIADDYDQALAAVEKALA